MKGHNRLISVISMFAIVILLAACGGGSNAGSGGTTDGINDAGGTGNTGNASNTNGTPGDTGANTGGAGATSDGSTSGGATAGDPVAAAQIFVQSLYAGGVVDGMLCLTDANAATSVRTAMEQTRDSAMTNGGTVDTSALTYMVTNQTADSAEVAVDGNLSITANGSTNASTFPPTTLRMRNEGGVWKVCG
ncbi:MAG: hypothetical protein KF726_04135 [Anaerolineae bacterium]|nr:hypothetical protein [Anaerolineae bacterium]